MRWLNYLLTRFAKIYGSIIFGLIAVAAYFWQSGGESESPPGHDSPATSEITLIANKASFTRPLPKGKWVLRVPRSYIHHVSGANFIGTHIVDLSMKIDTRSLELKSNPNSLFSDEGWSNYYILLQNQAVEYKVGHDELCFDDQDLRGNRKAPLPLKDGTPMVRDCSSPICEFRTAYKGWQVRFSIAKSEYMKKERYCQFTRNLLNGWTVEVDTLNEPDGGAR